MGRVCSMYEKQERWTQGLEGRPEGKRPVQNLGIDGRIILTQIFMKWNGGAGTGLIWLRIGTGGELL